MNNKMQNFLENPYLMEKHFGTDCEVVLHDLAKPYDQYHLLISGAKALQAEE